MILYLTLEYFRTATTPSCIGQQSSQYGVQYCIVRSNPHFLHRACNFYTPHIPWHSWANLGPDLSFLINSSKSILSIGFTELCKYNF